MDLKEFDFSTPVEVQTRVRALTNATRRAVEAPWEIEEAAKAAISGPIRFHLDASKGMGMLLPHLVSLKSYQNQFARGVVLKLREGNKEGGWTNLLAASRLVTAWEPESVEVSHLVRFACAKFAFEALSQGLQAGWNEEQLASLQRDWEEADFFKGVTGDGCVHAGEWGEHAGIGTERAGRTGNEVSADDYCAASGDG